MAGKAEKRTGLRQLNFDSLVNAPADNAGAITPENTSRLTNDRTTKRQNGLQRKPKQPDSLHDGLTQGTLDDLFATTQNVDVPLTFTPRDTSQIKGLLRQLTFDSVSTIPADTVEIAENTPAESDKQPLRRPPDVHSSPPEIDKRTGGRGIGSGIIPAFSRELQKREPEQKPLSPSRDFRITPEHQVGVGSLREKAHANIAAIKLLKTLEAESRDATTEEKAILVRYAGWGALAGVFETGYRRNSGWNEIASELEPLLSDKEYTAARASTPNAHFTSPLVIEAIWDGLERFGVGNGAEILEPAMGVGHFFGLMPETLEGGNRTGVELDPITARIARKLYPDTTIFAQGFETTPLPDNYFHTVVGNVPFGDYPVHDPEIRHSLTRSIHDYFFAKSLEKTRPGGILALITSRYTLDKQDPTVRKALAEQADLIAAIRLPNTTQDRDTCKTRT